MNTNQDGWSALAPRSVFGTGEGAQTVANVPTSQLGGGFNFSPGGVTINGNQIQSSGGLSFDLPLASIQAITSQALNFSANNSNVNRGFVGGVIANGQNNLTQTQNNVLGFGKAIMQTSQDLTQQALTTSERINNNAVAAAAASQTQRLDFAAGQNANVLGTAERMNTKAWEEQRKIAQYNFGTTMFTNAVNTLGSNQRMGTSSKVQGFQQPQQQQQSGGGGGSGIMGWLSSLFG